jgi:hypothetical protein
MSESGKSRGEIEEQLLAAVESAKSEYERQKAEHTRLSEIATDTGYLTRDGNLALDQAHHASLAWTKALSQYEDALRRFTDFIVSGKVPNDGEGSL